jgi:hypothetical protein
MGHKLVAKTVGVIFGSLIGAAIATFLLSWAVTRCRRVKHAPDAEERAAGMPRGQRTSRAGAQPDRRGCWPAEYRPQGDSQVRAPPHPSHLAPRKAIKSTRSNSSPSQQQYRTSRQPSTRPGLLPQAMWDNDISLQSICPNPYIPQQSISPSPYLEPNRRQPVLSTVMEDGISEQSISPISHEESYQQTYSSDDHGSRSQTSGSTTPSPPAIRRFLSVNTPYPSPIPSIRGIPKSRPKINHSNSPARWPSFGHSAEDLDDVELTSSEPHNVPIPSALRPGGWTLGRLHFEGANHSLARLSVATLAPRISTPESQEEFNVLVPPPAPVAERPICRYVADPGPRAPMPSHFHDDDSQVHVTTAVRVGDSAGFEVAPKVERVSNYSRRF